MQVESLSWFPGHMTKTRRMIAAEIGHMDAVCEILDARIPLASRNPDVDELTAGKPRLVVLNRVDQADPGQTRRWAAYFREKGYAVLEANAKGGAGTAQFAAAVRELLRDKLEAYAQKVNYKTSGLRKCIEAEIQPTIENEVGAENLVEHRVSLETVDGQNDYGELTCKVRPITFDEARKYNNLIVNNDLDDWWWTCTAWTSPNREYNRSIAVVLPSGVIRSLNCYGYGVRPVCILKSNIFVSKKGE